MTPAFWQGKRVLVTGHSGFKGCWLSHWLSTMGAQVSGVALMPATQPSLYELTVQPTQGSQHWADIRDLSALQRVLCAEAPELIFHLAAQSIVRTAYADPMETFSTNVMGTANILQTAREVPGLRAVIVVTSDKCYAQTDDHTAFDEAAALGANDPYSGSKACAELVAATWRRAYFEDARVATARAGNVIGGGDWSSDRLMTDLVRVATRGEVLRIRNPNAIRPWQHVLDALSGYLLLAERLWEDPRGFAGAWNFGPDALGEWTVAQVVGAFSRHWNAPLRCEMENEAQPHEVPVLRLDSSRARTVLGWRPKLNFEDALAWTVEWYRAWHRDPSSALDSTLRQIQQYQGRAIA